MKPGIIAREVWLPDLTDVDLASEMRARGHLHARRGELADEACALIHPHELVPEGIALEHPAHRHRAPADVASHHGADLYHQAAAHVNGPLHAAEDHEIGVALHLADEGHPNRNHRGLAHHSRPAGSSKSMVTVPWIAPPSARPTLAACTSP